MNTGQYDFQLNNNSDQKASGTKKAGKAKKANEGEGEEEKWTAAWTPFKDSGTATLAKRAAGLKHLREWMTKKWGCRFDTF